MKALSEPRILIVDDAEANVAVLVNVLRVGIRLSVAVDGEGAIRAVARNRRDHLRLSSSAFAAARRSC